MTITVRRVVTGHDDQGKAVILFDGVSDNVVSNRPGQSACVFWTADQVPATNDGREDAAKRPVGTSLDTGAVFRIVEYQPGVTPRNHRTDSMDYAIILSGEIDMVLDDTEVHLRAGDVVVQRGTIHNWTNRGTAPCQIAFVLVGAKPVTVNGRPLTAVG